MESLSKIRLSVTQLDQLCRSQLQAGLVAAQEYTQGWFNTIHRLELADGRQAVIKVSPPPALKVLRYEHNLLATEIQVLGLLARAGIPAPRVLAQAPGCSFFDHPYFIMEHVPGITLSARRQELEARQKATPDDPRPAARQQFWDQTCGRLQARINQLQPASPATWPEAFGRMVGQLLDDAADAGIRLSFSPTALRDRLDQAGPALARVRRPALVLWDLHDGNLLVNDPPAGPEAADRITGVLDCDRALWGDPLLECWFRTLWGGPSPHFVSAWLDQLACLGAGQLQAIHRSHPGEPDQETTAAGFLARAEVLERLHLYDLYLALVMRVEAVYRGYEAGHIAWTEGLLAQALASLGLEQLSPA